MKVKKLTEKNIEEKSKTLPQERYVAYFDGAGMRPDGTGSGYAWFIENNGIKMVQRMDGLTSNQAEYRGFLSLVKHLPEYSKCDLNSDSMLVVSQFNKVWAVRDPELKRLLYQVRDAIQERHLKVRLKWVPRRENRAGKLL